MLEFIIIILAVSLVFYAVFAGADFGAGIYELLCLITRQNPQKKLVESAIGPIWEANHIWLILAVVIFFMGFPKAFADFSIYMHIPLTMILFGITLRGTAFAFRHYDPIQDHWQQRYAWLFGLSSVWTAFWQGVVVAALFGKFPALDVSFFDAYIAPWANLFAFSVGVFVIAVYLYLAQTFFLGESFDDDEIIQGQVLRDFWRSLVFVIAAGGLVFISAWHSQPDFFNVFFSHPVSIACMVISTLLIIPIVRSYRKLRANLARVFVAVQVALIFLAVFIKRYPILISYTDGTELTYTASAAPEATLIQLTGALVVGVTVVLPALGILLKVFKTRLGNR